MSSKNSRWKMAGLWISLPIFNTCNQVAMKLAGQSLAGQAWGLHWLEAALRTPYLWLSIACEVINFALWLSILKSHNVSSAFPLTSISYAALLMVSWFIFQEPAAWQQIAGISFIILGVMLLGLQKKS